MEDGIFASAEDSSELRKKIAAAELEHMLNRIENDLFLFAGIVQDRETAARANAAFSAPLMKLRQKFGFPSGMTVKTGKVVKLKINHAA